VKLKTGTRWTMAVAFVLVLSLAPFTGAGASDKKDKKGKEKPTASPTVDSGSFGIFIKGQRVATETFHIEQQDGNSVIKSQLKETSGADPASQKSDLEINANGELLRYEWSQSSGGALSVFPDNEFLKERITTSTTAKPAEQAYLLPSSSPILDNNFFVHREVLAWKYLHGICQASSGDTKCRQEPADFGALVPQDRTSMSVRMELVGKEKITIRGVEHELMRLNLSGESFQWALWVDDHDHYKLMRVSIPADDTIVDRD
jgi:hypothetical protein